ncbi:hypothetical protein HFP89_14385 [Wenzhouxiangella sp. XN79A]|uniref:hypothetical protein n=1 Tax=Wenzhouxiangella sp. XN79A TaxID=2724193 RepID=UPI00144A94AA|nr:hypothetical protein [Wenzhouxiangella sp. XN79A]NKI36355.1 hypothetical protein [Wenzhouxiangella sp. XN79A]
MLDDDLVDWILVLTLIGDSRTHRAAFIHAVDPERLTQTVDLDIDELREFFDTLLNKIRPGHERYELDWLHDVAERLCLLLEDVRELAAWRGAADRESAGFASTIAAEVSERLPTEDATRTLQQLMNVIARSVTAADQSADAEQNFRRYAALLAGSESERPIWRSTQRIAAQLSRIDQPLSSTAGARLHGVLRALSQFEVARSAGAADFREVWAAVSMDWAPLAAEYIDRALGAEREVSGPGLVEFASDDVVAGRTRPETVVEFFESGIVERVASSLNLDREDVAAMIDRGMNESTVLRLWTMQNELAAELAGTDERARQRFRRIITLLARLPGNKTPRVDEEWQIWIVPEVHWLLRHDFPAQADCWKSLTDALQANLSAEQQRGIAQFFHSLLGLGTRAASASRSAVPDRALATPPIGDSSGASEPFQHAVQHLLARFNDAEAPDWQSAWMAALDRHGDFKIAVQDILPIVGSAIGARGFSIVAEELQQLEGKLAAELEAPAAALWIQLLGELRAIARRITIGRCWSDDAGLLGRRALSAAADAAGIAGSLPAALPNALVDSVRHMGDLLASETEPLIALELPRYWLASVLPIEGGDPDFPVRFAAALAKETSARVPDECQAAVVGWTSHLGQAASHLSNCRVFAERILQAEEHLFTEDKASEAEWRSFLGGMVVAASLGDWRGGRAELCQTLVDATPTVAGLPPETWKSSSAALIKRLREALDERLLPELIACQTEIGKALVARQQLNALDSVESDVRGWCRGRAVRGEQRLWQHFVVASRRTFGMAHQSFIDVSQLNDWPLPDETTVKSQMNLLRAALHSASSADPNALRGGLLKRSVPKIAEHSIEAVRASARDYAFAVARGDDFGQRSALVQLCARPLADWSFDDVQRFAETIDASIYRQSSTEREAAEKRSSAVAQAWLAARLSSHGARWIEAMQEAGGWSTRLNRTSTATSPLDSLTLVHVLAMLALMGRISTVPTAGTRDGAGGTCRIPRIEDPAEVRRLRKMLRSHLPKNVHAFCEPVALALLSPPTGGHEHA